MNEIKYTYRATGFSVNGVHDRAIVLADEEPRQALIDAVVHAIGIDIKVKLGEVELHLAAIMDPDHWSEEWESAGIEDADDFIAGLVREERE